MREETARSVSGLRCSDATESPELFTCRSPAITTVLQSLNRLKVPSVALYVVGLPFNGGFESLPLRHSLMCQEN
jgi:hypothetical protein